MKREVKKAVTRCRRAQDAVYNNKVEGCSSIAIMQNSLLASDGEKHQWFTVWAHIGQPVEKACKSWTFADDSTPEDIEKKLTELSKYINYEV